MCMCVSVYVSVCSCIGTYIYIQFFIVWFFFFFQDLKEVEELIKVKKKSINCLKKTFIIALLIFIY